MRARILNTILAELAVFLTVSIVENSPLSMFVPAKFLYVIAVIPIVFLLLGRNPFDFPLFLVLIALATVKILSNSEIFYSILDAVYYLGFKGAAEYLNSLFTAYKSSNVQVLSVLVILFSVAQIAWNIEVELSKLRIDFVQPISVLIVVAFAIYVLYPAILSIQVRGIPLLFVGLLGVVLTLIATYLLAST